MKTIKVRDINGDSRDLDFEALFLEHHQMVYRTALKVTGSEPDAEDVVQAVFLKMLQANQSELRKNAAGYLYRAAKNRALNLVRERRRDQNPNDEAEEFDPPAEPELPESPEPDVEQRRRLNSAIATLKPEAAKMLILRYEHDLSEIEIARMLGITRAKVSVTLTRARALLRTRLKREK